MRLLLIRHGDPDYSVDGLTEKGKREAALLAGRLAGTEITEFYVSPLGRAQDTAAYTLQKLNRTAETCSWLQEFPVPVLHPEQSEKNSVVWDWLPRHWTQRENFYDRNAWAQEPELAAAGVEAEYRRVTAAFDALLAAHGYVRDGRIYRAERPNRDTLAFFCHFGLTCVLLSHLMQVSPMILWHHMVFAPTSVTSLYTEEREAGIAVFRADMLGDISHLSAAGEPPAFSARFCETFDSPDERH